MKHLLQFEPVMAGDVAKGVLILLTAFGVQVTPAQADAIVVVVGLLAGFAVTWWQRRRVTPVAKLEEQGVTLDEKGRVQ